MPTAVWTVVTKRLLDISRIYDTWVDSKKTRITISLSDEYFSTEYQCFIYVYIYMKTDNVN